MFQIPTPGNESLLSYCGGLVTGLLAADGSIAWITAGLFIVALAIACWTLWILDRAPRQGRQAGWVARTAGAAVTRLHLEGPLRKLRQSPNSSRAGRFAIVVMLCLFVASAGYTGLKVAAGLAARGNSAAAANVGKPGGAFSLVDHTNQTVNDQAFRGRFMLVAFGYTFCPDVCPTTLATLTETLDRLDTAAARVAPLFITIDPARDTPAVLRDFIANFHPAIRGLSGSAEQVKTAARAFKVYFAKADASGSDTDYAMEHSTLLYLLGRDGEFLQSFPHFTPPGDIAAAIRARLAIPVS